MALLRWSSIRTGFLPWYVEGTSSTYGRPIRLRNSVIKVRSSHPASVAMSSMSGSLMDGRTSNAAMRVCSSRSPSCSGPSFCMINRTHYPRQLRHWTLVLILVNEPIAYPSGWRTRWSWLLEIMDESFGTFQCLWARHTPLAPTTSNCSIFT